MNRRKFLQTGVATTTGSAFIGCTSNQPAPAESSALSNIRHNPIGVSTYSFWQFNGHPKTHLLNCVLIMLRPWAIMVLSCCWFR